MADRIMGPRPSTVRPLTATQWDSTNLYRFASHDDHSSQILGTGSSRPGTAAAGFASNDPRYDRNADGVIDSNDFAALGGAKRPQSIGKRANSLDTDADGIISEREVRFAAEVSHAVPAVRRSPGPALLSSVSPMLIDDALCSIAPCFADCRSGARSVRGSLRREDGQAGHAHLADRYHGPDGHQQRQRAQPRRVHGRARSLSRRAGAMK